MRPLSIMRVALLSTYRITSQVGVCLTEIGRATGYLRRRLAASCDTNDGGLGHAQLFLLD